MKECRKFRDDGTMYRRGDKMRIINERVDATDIFEKIGENSSEINSDQHGFICELIKEITPKKIIEIGVSGGGTTCVLLNCIQKLGLECEIYSVDYSHTYHCDTSKECGYQIKDAISVLENSECHHLLLGHTIAEKIEEIAVRGSVDLLILDTIHYLPGELLDFIVCFPYLSSNAVVVLDDLIFAHAGENTEAVATKILFDSVTAEKLFPSMITYPNLAAFRINEDTEKYIMDVFSALIIPWSYMLDEKQINAYRDLIKKNYSMEYVDLFEEAIRLNYNTLKNEKAVKEIINDILKCFTLENSIYIYGAGARGNALKKFLEDRGKQIKGFIISDGRKDVIDSDLPVHYLSEIDKDKSFILVAVHSAEVRQLLISREMRYYDISKNVFPFIKDYAELLLR